MKKKHTARTARHLPPPVAGLTAGNNGNLGEGERVFASRARQSCRGSPSPHRDPSDAECGVNGMPYLHCGQNRLCVKKGYPITPGS